MPIREWQLRILDMLTCVENAMRYTAGMAVQDFERDQKTIDAVIRNIEIIGEAANHVPKRIRDKYDRIPWTDVRGMRNIVAHSYFGIDLGTVWGVVTARLPELKHELERLRKAEGL